MTIKRQKIIDRAINIENNISVLIAMHFFPDSKAINGDFVVKVLCDPLASVGLKINVFEKCYPDYDQKNIQLIRRLFNIRNIFAHAGFRWYPAGSVEPVFPDPKDTSKEIDFERLATEFETKANELKPSMDKLFAEKKMLLGY